MHFTHHRAGLVPVRGSAAVRSAALDEALRRVHRLLAGCPAIVANLRAAGVELQLIGEHEAVTDLPQYRHMHGVPFEGTRTMDERGRGYGGLFPCCAEEALLELPTASHSDHRDVCTHELAHAVLSYGLDSQLRDRVEHRYQAALTEGLWGNTYASTNHHEFFAELSMWFVGSRGDYGLLPHPEAGSTWLRRYDPRSWALLHQLYTGVRRPAPVHWQDLLPGTDDRSIDAKLPTSIVFHNHSTHDLELFWLDYQGAERPYGLVPNGGLLTIFTFASHSWILRGDVSYGPYTAGLSPGRVTIEEALQGDA